MEIVTRATSGEKVTWYEKEAMFEEEKEGLFLEMNLEMDPRIYKSQ